MNLHNLERQQQMSVIFSDPMFLMFRELIVGGLDLNKEEF